ITAIPNTQFLDNGDAGFSTTGPGWSTATGGGYLNDIHYAAAGSGANTATWAFTVYPGIYQVSATWNAAANRATNAPFQVFDTVNPVASANLNQQATPADFTDSGVGWKNIGTQIYVFSNSLTIKLSDAANGIVIADGIRIQKVGTLSATAQAQVLDGPAA